MKPQLPSPALVISILALFAAFTGGAVAASKITGKQVKDGSITGKDIKNDSLTGADIRGKVAGDRGPRGPAGARGPTGASGEGGGVGKVVYRGQAFPLDAGETLVRRATCPDGLVALGGGVSALDDSVIVRWDRPVGVASEVPDSWEARVTNTTDTAGGGIVWVTCIAAPGEVTDDTPR